MSHSRPKSSEEPNPPSPLGASTRDFQTPNPLAGMPPYDPIADPTGDGYAAAGLRRAWEATKQQRQQKREQEDEQEQPRYQEPTTSAPNRVGGGQASTKLGEYPRQTE
jgi:hypothetical protein